MQSSDKFFKGNRNGIIYFDNAATSFPKPKAVIESIIYFLTEVGANPGRSGHHRAIEAGKIVFQTRKAIAQLFNIKNPMRVIFTSNATEALNLAILGLLKKGDHVITSSLEHNSTIRPLQELKKSDIINLTIIPTSPIGKLDFKKFKNSILPTTKAVIINHASNVIGSVQPLEKIGEICKKMGIIFIVDCAQTAGVISIDMKRDKIDILAFTGHKGLYGPTGTGGMVIADNFDYSQLSPLKYGGTGSLSDQIEQPNFLPDRYESGTLNVAGINGLLAGINHINNLDGGMEQIRKKKCELQRYFIAKAGEEIPKFINYSPTEDYSTGVISFRLADISVSHIAQLLSDNYRIMCRHGLHCSPLAHKTIGTYPAGTVRFSFGIFNSKEEIDYAIMALKEISREITK